MFKSLRLLALFGLAAGVAACASQEPEEFVIVEPEPITVEPVYSGKYK